MKKFFKRLLLVLLGIVLLFSVFAVVTGKTYLFKAIAYNFADIDDYKKFTNNSVAAGVAQPWPRSAIYNQPEMPDTLTRFLRELKTIGLVVIKHDSILYEKYWEGYNDSSYSNSFSVAKSITSLLLGVAIKEGKIGSVNDLVSKYLPGFAEGEKARLRIVHLLTMSSGSDWNESYADPFSVTTELYYGSRANEVAAGVEIIREPGTQHSYKSGDTQLLAMIIEKATGQSLSNYASEKLWKPLGAEHPALWSTDKNGGNEKAYCCFNTNARDFARIGQLMLDSGTWKGNEIITPDYFAQSVKPCMLPDETGQTCNYYGYQWWIYPAPVQIFYARGILGQYIIVIPSKDLVLVRLGKKRSDLRKNMAPLEVEKMIQWALAL
jgi:CubicO group peptidase (beta-lactamase class C family)